ERVLQMQQAYVRSLEADVIAFANKGFFGQLFSFGEANVNIDALEKAEADLRAVRRELDAIDTQIGQVRVMEITPNVTPPPPGSFDIPEDGEVRNVEVVVTVRSATTSDELFGALLGERTAVNRAVAR